MDHKKYSLSKEVITTLEQLFSSYDIDFTFPKKISEAVVNLSNTYKTELSDHSDIWSNPRFVKAYLAYFLPLNVLRLTSVFNELQNHIDLKSINEVYDYGSGPGTSHLALNNLNIEPNYLFNFDKSKTALKVHQSWANGKNINFTQSLNNWQNIKSNSLGIFSYAFNELKNLPEQINKHDHLLIVEPSNQKPARRLQQQRPWFNNLGYKLIAPCTHQGDCPLLKHSKKDWCHNRVFTELPYWFNDLEKFIPMKNQNITYSYLFVSKIIQPQASKKIGRVIGDTLKEKGKTRQAFCRSDEREFLSWLKKDGPFKELNRGSLYELSHSFEKKGNELRKP